MNYIYLILAMFSVSFAVMGGAISAFADHSEVTIVTAEGSAVPGCEETAEGCYIPRTATVDVGGTVIMSNTDTAAHTFTAGTPSNGPSGEFDSGLMLPGSSFEYSPDTVGEIPYFCMIHPWSVGLLVVQDDDPNPEQFCDGMTINELVASGMYNVIDNRDGSLGVAFFGTEMNDLILASDAGNDIFAGPGDDCIIGGSSVDLILGGLGDDTIFGGNGNDMILGNGDNDILNGGNDDDRLFGGFGEDQIFGDAGNDRTYGGIEDDVVDGGAGNDIINGGLGDDTCISDAEDTVPAILCNL